MHRLNVAAILTTFTTDEKVLVVDVACVFFVHFVRCHQLSIDIQFDLLTVELTGDVIQFALSSVVADIVADE